MKKMIKKTLLSLILLLGGYVASAQITKHQAVYLFNFTRYVEWPTEYKSGNFIIGVFGKKEEITKELEAIASKRKAGIQDIKVIEFASIAEISKCHILFVPNKKVTELSAIKAKVTAYNTLVITDASKLKDGAGINFLLDANKLKFQINEATLTSNGLKVSDKLTAMASN